MELNFSLEMEETIEPFTLAQMMKRKKEPDMRKLLVIDCRRFLDYNTAHVKNSVNVGCSKLIRRRLVENKMCVLDLLYQQLSGNELVDCEPPQLDVILYDDHSGTALSSAPLAALPCSGEGATGRQPTVGSRKLCCAAEKIRAANCPALSLASTPAHPTSFGRDVSFLKILQKKLESEHFNSVKTLKGGFVDFNASYPDLCEGPGNNLATREGSMGSPSLLSSGKENDGLRLSGSRSQIYGSNKSTCLTSLSQPCLPVSARGPTRILPFLYLGSHGDAMDREMLKRYGITYVLNMSVGCSKPDFVQDEHFLRIPVNDSQSEKLLPYFEQAFEFLDKVREANACVIVHCLAGISRSPTLAIAYVMKYLHMSSEEAYRYVKEKRPSISPNFNFLGQLLEYEKQLRFFNVTGRERLLGSRSFGPNTCSPLMETLAVNSPLYQQLGDRSLRFFGVNGDIPLDVPGIKPAAGKDLDTLAAGLIHRCVSCPSMEELLRPYGRKDGFGSLDKLIAEKTNGDGHVFSKRSVSSASFSPDDHARDGGRYRLTAGCPLVRTVDNIDTKPPIVACQPKLTRPSLQLSLDPGFGDGAFPQPPSSKNDTLIVNVMDSVVSPRVFESLGSSDAPYEKPPVDGVPQGVASTVEADPRLGFLWPKPCSNDASIDPTSAEVEISERHVSLHGGSHNVSPVFDQKVAKFVSSESPPKSGSGAESPITAPPKQEGAAGCLSLPSLDDPFLSSTGKLVDLWQTGDSVFAYSGITSADEAPRRGVLIESVAPASNESFTQGITGFQEQLELLVDDRKASFPTAKPKSHGSTLSADSLLFGSTCSIDKQIDHEASVSPGLWDFSSFVSYPPTPGSRSVLSERSDSAISGTSDFTNSFDSFRSASSLNDNDDTFALPNARKRSASHISPPVLLGSCFIPLPTAATSLSSSVSSRSSDSGIGTDGPLLHIAIPYGRKSLCPVAQHPSALIALERADTF